MILASGPVDRLLFHIAEALRVPVLVLALATLALVLVEAGGFLVEASRRRVRRGRDLTASTDAARWALGAGDTGAVRTALAPLARSAAMRGVLEELAADAGLPASGERMAKRLADFDLRSVRRLERTRLLVRFGPALGLAGTLIPLSPALAGLARGDVQRLSDDLRVAFSVTVVGLLVGAIAFGISLVRDRFYAEDLSDLEYVAALLSAPGDWPEPPEPAPAPEPETAVTAADPEPSA